MMHLREVSLRLSNDTDDSSSARRSSLQTRHQVRNNVHEEKCVSSCCGPPLFVRHKQCSSSFPFAQSLDREQVYSTLTHQDEAAEKAPMLHSIATHIGGVADEDSVIGVCRDRHGEIVHIPVETLAVLVSAVDSSAPVGIVVLERSRPHQPGTTT